MAVGTSAKVGAFQGILDNLMALSFVMKTTTKRVSDPPWVNTKIRKLSRKRRKIYDKEGRSPRWKELKKQCRELYNKRTAVYMEEQKKSLTAPDASRAFFKNAKAYQTREKPTKFDVRDLYPGTTDTDIAGTLVDHFNAIRSEFEGLRPDQVPVCDPGFLPFLSTQEVGTRLAKFRKLKSKNVDDNVIVEKVNFDSVPTDGFFFRLKHVVQTQNLFRRIVHQAESVGMKVHPGKTVTMLISELKSYNPCAYFFDQGGVRVENSQSLKILGMHFSSDPDMRAQVEATKKGFRTKKRILHHLKHRGFGVQDLLAVYKSIILPAHDYRSCVFNSSLTLSQASSLERQQA